MLHIQNSRLLEYNWVRLCYFKKELNFIKYYEINSKTELKAFLENIFALKFVWMELKLSKIEILSQV